MNEMTKEEHDKIDKTMGKLASGVINILRTPFGPDTKKSLIDSGLDDVQDNEAALFGFIMQESHRYGMMAQDASTLALTILWVQRKIREQLVN